MITKTRLIQEVEAIFRKLNLPMEGDKRIPTNLWHNFDPTRTPAPGVEYRTILTNGTGVTPSSGHAELE